MISKAKRTLKVTSNQSKRTFTLRFTYKDGTKKKYRTLPMSKYEFENCEYNTENDWNQFLKSDDYYEVK